MDLSTPVNTEALRSSQGRSAPGRRVAPLADLAFEEDEDTVPSTPYSRGCTKILRARRSAGPVLAVVLGWLSAALGWMLGRR